MIKTLQYSIQIQKPQAIVFNTLVDKNVYNDWAKAFSPGTTMEGEWKQGAEILFFDPAHGGTKAVLTILEPYSRILATHIGMVDKDHQEYAEPYDEATQKWIGTTDDYTFHKEDNEETTTFKVEIQTDEMFQSMFDESWPKALALFKELCEKRE